MHARPEQSSLRRRAFWLIAALLSLSLVAGACGSDDDDEPAAEPDTTETTEAPRLAAATLASSGATFPKPFYEEVIAAFKQEQPAVTINYAGGGSGAGRTQLGDQVVDWAGSDGLVKAEDRPKFKGGEFLYFPTVAAPITVSYNLNGVDELKLDAPTIAKIFQREIKTWNDPAIASQNSGTSLPSTNIVVAHRSDSSGTTENFTKYLDAAAPTDWKLTAGSTVDWPADTQAGNGNAGVAQIVKSTPGAIGYVDFSDAKASGLSYAQVKNAAGQYKEPTIEGTTAALETAEVKPDLSYNPLNAPGAEAYPISAPTWILAYKNWTDKAKGEAFKAFMNFLYSQGQTLAKDVDYARLPQAMVDRGKAQLDQLVLPA